MKTSVTFILVLICTVVLAAKQSQAKIVLEEKQNQEKKGCSAYGMACYGGHGKRAVMDNNNNAVNGAILGSEQDDFPSEYGLRDNNADDIETYPPYRLIRIMKSWFNAHPRRFPMDRMNEVDYSAYADAALNRDRTNN